MTSLYPRIFPSPLPILNPIDFVNLQFSKMKFSSSHLLVLAGCILEGVNALGQNATVTLTADKGLLQLAGSGVNGQILVSANDWWGVLRAAEDLAGDMGKVTGRNLTLGNWLASGTGKRDIEVEERDAPEAEERDVAVGPQGGSPGEGGPGFPSGGHEGGWGWGGKGQSGAHPPGSPGHNVTSTGSSGTTVYYSFNPVTSFINASPSPQLSALQCHFELGDEGLC